MKLYLHLKFPNLHDKGFYTYTFEVPENKLETYSKNLTVKQFFAEVSKFRADLNPAYIKISTSENAKPLLNVDMLFSSFFEDGSDIFLLCDAPKPVLVSEEKRIYYETLKKFSFYESGDWSVKVNVDIPGVGQLEANKITSRFLENSFEVKIHDLRGKNYLFSVTRASNNIDADKSKIIVKDDSIVVVLRKAKKDDHWFALHKQKMIGD